MTGKHLTYFKVQNFKRFAELEVKNIGQINLIIGDNNVGKTSLLEALLFSQKPYTLMGCYYRILKNRGMHIPDFSDNDLIEEPIDHLLPLFNDNKKTEIIYDYHLKFHRYSNNIVVTAESMYRWNEGGQFKGVNLSVNIHSKEHKQAFTGSEQNYLHYQSEKELGLVAEKDGDLKDLLSYYQKSIIHSKSRRKEFVENLSIIIPKLEEVLPNKVNGREMLYVSVTDQDELIPISQYGHGTLSFTRILLEIINYKDSRLMIDEIASGIHYSRMTNFWDAVIRMCEKYNVQLFATTHSLDCLNGLAEALENEDFTHIQQEARVIKLADVGKTQAEKRVNSFVYNFEEFATLTKIDVEIR